ncbi:MAG TPA: hypothetical protein VIK99_01605 [Thermaerobacter sp.]
MLQFRMPVHEGACPYCGGDVETTRIEGREGYWWRCRGCGWTIEATAYDAFGAAWAEFLQAWWNSFGPIFMRLYRPLIRLAERAWGRGTG